MIIPHIEPVVVHLWLFSLNLFFDVIFPHFLVKIYSCLYNYANINHWQEMNRRTTNKMRSSEV